MNKNLSLGRALVIESLLERLVKEKLISARELKRLQVLKALEVEALFKF